MWIGSRCVKIKKLVLPGEMEEGVCCKRLQTSWKSRDKWGYELIYNKFTINQAQFTGFMALWGQPFQFTCFCLLSSELACPCNQSTGSAKLRVPSPMVQVTYRLLLLYNQNISSKFGYFSYPFNKMLPLRSWNKSVRGISDWMKTGRVINIEDLPIWPLS